jgi:ribosomal protein S18 acetylase RimI-like enzyme
MSMGPVQIRQAGAADAAAISALAKRVFFETFSHATPPDDMRQFLEETFQPALQEAEIADANRVVLVAIVDDEIAGFAQLRRETSIELQRLYVDKRWHGRGVAKALMDEVMERACRSGCEKIWLGVWEHNFRAQAFYRKYGFEVCGSHVFPVGNDPQIDLLMSRRL